MYNAVVRGKKMNKYDEFLKKLDREGNAGCDFSPGNPICKEAASVIRELIACVELWQGKTQYEQTQAKIRREIQEDSCAWGKDK